MQQDPVSPILPPQDPVSATGSTTVPSPQAQIPQETQIQSETTNNNLPPATPTPQAPQPPALDPNISSLAQGIALQEGGGQVNYTQSGDNGAALGAYQWENEPNGVPTPLQQGQLPSNWISDATTVGADPTDFSPQNQDKVAYLRVKEMIDSGDTAAKVASIWNLGDPSGWKNYNQTTGNTPQYVANVEQYYNQQLSKNSTLQGTGASPFTPSSQDLLHQSSTTPNLDKILGLATLTAAGVGLAFIPGIGDAVDAGVVAPEIAADLGETAEATQPNMAQQAWQGLKSGLGIGTGGPIASQVGNAVGSAAKVAALGLGAKILFGSNPAQANYTPPSSDNSDQQLQDLEESIPQSQQASRVVSDGLSTALGNSVAGAKFLSSDAGQEGVSDSGTYGASIVQGPGGTMNANPGLEKLGQYGDDLASTLKGSLKAEGTTADIAEAQKSAFDEIDSNENYSPTEKSQMKAAITREAESYDQGQTGLDKLESAKYQQQKNARYDGVKTTAVRNAHKHFASGLRKTVEKHTKNKDLYNRSLKEQSKIHNAEKALKLLHGHKIPAIKKGLVHSLVHEYAKYTGLALGAKIGGPLGAVLGDIVGEKLTRSVDRRFGKNLFETPSMRHAMNDLKKQAPAVHTRILKDFKRFGVTLEQEKAEKAKSDVTKSHQEWQKETMAKRKEEKRSAYTEKKKGLLGVEPKKSEYEPYQNPSVIKTGKKPIPKTKKPTKGLPTIKF